MNKITILVGPQASGKTTLANEMAVGKKTVTITDSSSIFPYGRKLFDVDTNLIVLEEVTDINQINYIIGRDKISAIGARCTYFTIDRPEIIIITQKLDETLLDKDENVEIIHCKHHDPWPVVLDEYKELSNSDVQNLKASFK